MGLNSGWLFLDQIVDEGRDHPQVWTPRHPLSSGRALGDACGRWFHQVACRLARCACGRSDQPYP